MEPNAFIGGEPGEFSRLTRHSGRTVAPGDAGYGRTLSRQASALAESRMANYQAEVPQTVEPPWAALDADIGRRRYQHDELSAKAEDPRLTPQRAEMLRCLARWCREQSEHLVHDRSALEELAIHFNAFRLFVRLLFGLLSRLDAMCAMLGVRHIERAVERLEAALHEAARGEAGAKRPTLPAVEHPLGNLAKQTSSATQELVWRHLAYRRGLSAAEAEAEAPGEDATRERMTEAIAQLELAIEALLLKLPTLGSIDTTADEAASVGETQDDRQPTESLCEREFRNLTLRLVTLEAALTQARSPAFDQVLSSLLLLHEQCEQVEEQFTAFEQALYEQRRLYLSLGEALDLERRRSTPLSLEAEARRVPDRQATVLVLVAQMRELIATGEGLRQSFPSPAALDLWWQELVARRCAQPPDPELDALVMDLDEIRSYERWQADLAQLAARFSFIARCFAPVEDASRRLLRALASTTR